MTMLDEYQRAADSELPSYVSRHGKYHRVVLPTPSIGGKCWVLSQKGLFVLEVGPGTLRTTACTHIGSGSIVIHDGVPGEDGNFPDERTADDDEASGLNGRALFRANPAVMGSWMLDAGFVHGLTVRASGGSDATAAIASIVWMPFRGRV